VIDAFRGVPWGGRAHQRDLLWGQAVSLVDEVGQATLETLRFGGGVPGWDDGVGVLALEAGDLCGPGR
jgi:hypothetical protein